MLWILVGSALYGVVMIFMIAGQIDERRTVTRAEVPAHARHAIILFSAFWPLYLGLLCLGAVCMRVALAMLSAQRLVEHFLAPKDSASTHENT